MKNVLADGRWTHRGGRSVGAAGPVQQLEGVGVESRGGGPSRYCPGAPSDHPHSPHPARRGVHMWSVGAAGQVQQPEQTR